MEHIVNKTLLNATCAVSDDAIAVLNPATDEILAYIPSLDTQTIHELIARSKQAQLVWQEKSAAERSVILKRWYDLMLDNADDLARIMTLEQGKPLAEAKGEVMYGASFIQWFAEEGKRTYGDTIPSPAGNKRLLTVKQPIGVAAAITPWNFPIAMITRKAAPALAAGCSFIVKPANQTPLSAYATAELAYQAGLPQDLLIVLNNHSSVAVGDIFCTHEDIKKLSFTGSTQVGRHLITQCAGTIKRTSMELGGNAPFIVFDDADIDAAVQGAIASKFRNAGQTCVCANRFYVQDAVYDEFVTKFVAAVAELKMGNGLETGVNIGPLIDIKAKNSVLGYINTAVEQGASIALGGKSAGGLFVEPTVLTNVTQEMDIVQTELFGPVAPIVRFSHDEELVSCANDTIYGLASYFYTNNIHRAFHIAEKLEYGMVGINEGLISNEVAPFGGVKQSGFGREGAKQGIDEYLNIKYLCFGGF
ncbi:NAD-dependent succinate-semialdehyde dehydrogenase [Vibrio fluvialis]|uniref:NAD-dependent succinate-semialdehyde dehydrogenase n=1 Tax=Vibrio fluvialis TaxID=676 RepID=UPI001C9D5B95|nr:NAD-dependent succinate-semialdehyde dehydrogenase [Vibrio fluvialis]EKO3910613.1 NAD-dependent succinate-semialdehyde dehydrogenase [Vibrio fluvialis]MBY7802368.1 NAD-dependent succinate-semialdehyde dehydrogenase [Vibrio fluvialis]MBY7861106.1 NAD-dependent succinate-semialdehyde dehydrogenase [Vibrio fluvialis]MBY7871004.1 NAD-dependent succinate-semialdehyde dehydrogenase [Vibrio fluvialis]MBY8025471.1 NAD-dependent succinate-semialdehyde dehydrogenase [Vibrio fluvialis]